MNSAAHAVPNPSARRLPIPAMLAALGIVYGDIGTSPLYALKEAVKAASAGGVPDSAAVLGALSVVFWALILIIGVKYAILILRADNHGEGGIVAMLALLHARDAPPRSWRALLLIVGLVGAALLYGDGAITPAISVLSAMEGLQLDAPALKPLVLPLTVGVLVALFAGQHRGTGFIGQIFGPVMLVWFGVIGILGIGGIIRAPSVLAALNPVYALSFMLHADAAVSFAMLGAAFLAVTGGEAMYADMGHFGRTPIRLAWFGLVLPCLVLNYFGQGGILLTLPDAIENPFYQLAPGWAHYPLVALATAATVIASQAIISGTFSLTQQSIQLGFLPWLDIKHTGSREIGQVYLPTVNWLLALATLGAAIAFGTSDSLAGAYGIAVSALMAITTMLAALVALQWGYSPALVLIANGGFLLIDLVFFAANGMKLLEGGWFPLALAILVAFVMLTWRRGQILVEGWRAGLREPEEDLVRRLGENAIIRLPGTVAFLGAAATGIPLPMTRFLRVNHALHQRVLIVTVQMAEVPLVRPDDRAEVASLGAGLTRVVLHYGFTEAPDIPAGFRLAAQQRKLDGDIDVNAISYITGRETVIPSEGMLGMPHWREMVFAFLCRNSQRNAVYFGVPPSQVVEIGTEIEI